VGTKVLVEIPAGQNQKEAFPRRRCNLAAWAEQEGRLERVELLLDLICGRWLSTVINSLTGKYGGGSPLRWEHG
jgi:hypothetical protein